VRVCQGRSSLGRSSLPANLPDHRPAGRGALGRRAGERARRVHRLQRVEASFIPLPFDVEAARRYGIIAAEVIAMGRKPSGRVADLMIASMAAANELPLFTTNPADFRGLESVVTAAPVPVPGPAS
jgi:predicted nucleic acid-binding protein